MSLSPNSVPLTALQKGMVYAGLTSGGKSTNILQAVLEMDSPVNPADLNERIAAVVERTDLLRVVLEVAGDSDPVWRTEPSGGPELRTAQVGDRGIESFLEEDRLEGFPLEGGRLWRLTWVVTDGSGFLVLTVHTALADRTTASWILGELLAPAVDLSRSMSDSGMGALVERLKRDADSGDAEYWAALLDDVDSPTAAPLGEEPTQSEPSSVKACVRHTDLDLSGLPPSLSSQALFEAGASLVLSYYNNADKVVYGSVKDLRSGWQDESASGPDVFALGPAVVPLPVISSIGPDLTLRQLLEQHQESGVQAIGHASVGPLDLMVASGFDSKEGLFPFVLLVESPGLAERLGAHGVPNISEAWFDETPPYGMMLYATTSAAGVVLRLRYDAGRLTDEAASMFLLRCERALEALMERPDGRCADVRLLLPEDPDWAASRLEGQTAPAAEDQTVDRALARVARETPDKIALVDGPREYTYGELERRANQLASLLVERGVAPGDLVALAVDRSIEAVIGMIGVMKTGAGYVPMDPNFPSDRLQFMLEDSAASVALVSGGGLDGVNLAGIDLLEVSAQALDRAPSDHSIHSASEEDSVAYVIYTSGSTGRPKGVMVEHRNVLNFFAGMDDRVPHTDPERVWLAVTSVSFDISVLELLWTLARGFKVVLFDPTASAGTGPRGATRDGGLPLGLFYFAADEAAGGANPYRLLMEGARFADANGFSAIWTPERHFHAFGGLYPNAAVTGAAVAAITERVGIRAGSVVLPLHHPARVAEEWSVVDNLSEGRVGVAFASGWHPNDFVLRPEGFEKRKAGLFEWADEVQRLWRGETLEYVGPTGEMVPVTTLPRPVQNELPVWVTAAGSPETVRRAAEAGHHLLTHLLGQTIEELTDRIRLYQEVRREAGFSDPGKVAVMLHTFVGERDDEVREEVRGPMVEYLRSSMGLVKNHLTAWEAFSKKATDASAPKGDEFDRLSDEDISSLLNFSFERYYETSALLGSKERTQELMHRVLEAGATEIACLIDFGVDESRALEALPLLKAVGETASKQSGGYTETPSLDETFAGLIAHHGVTHLQCTPSLARLLMADAANTEAMSALSVVLIGGEAFSNALAKDLRSHTSATILNMYGPTEATVWASTREVTGDESWGTVPLGKPLSNLGYRVVDRFVRPLPAGVAGELLVVGDNVTRGYWRRAELTEERFPTLSGSGERVYRTGDLVRIDSNGELLFLGRIDQQVKIRGHRIELGEIEAVLCGHPEVSEAAVTLSPEGRLTGYYVGEVPEGAAANTLKEWTRTRLPEVMVPSHWVRLDTLPKTPNMKVDRNALSSEAVPAAGVVEPAATQPLRLGAAELQKLVLGVWQDELGIEDISPDDNFFDIGGHSLLVVQVHLRLKSALGRDLAITDLFQHPTVRSFAASLVGDESDSAPMDQGQKRAAMRKRMRSRAG
ncbi:MAG: MupA/Atu3671 family FMN-dependent luciferase-like monooxygenase, partial [Longimicrobiales bacterium]